ncbi:MULTISPECIES: helix-turn-helix domain-containing protein [Virgibacillus]|uniref:helix-turn-helix domain-containing protein n=1 Tax=Virgibacillus TaxID=84406 RepID=UPI000EF51510|nr:helix-turn-helix domain-containing protein [Virgibacillus sp. Bac332]
MTDWKKLIERSQHGDLKSMIALIDRFKPKIRNLLKQTSYQERENLEQELLIISINVINSFNTKKVPGFWEFLNNVDN